MNLIDEFNELSTRNVSTDDFDRKLMKPVLDKYGYHFTLNSPACDVCRKRTYFNIYNQVVIKGFKFFFCSKKCEKQFKEDVMVMML